jgi:hypothetical protein
VTRLGVFEFGQLLAFATTVSVWLSPRDSPTTLRLFNNSWDGGGL